MKAGAWVPALFLAFLNAFALAEAQSPPESFSEPGTTAVQPLVPQVIIRELTFEGDLDLPVPDQDVIAAEVKGRRYIWPLKWQYDPDIWIAAGWTDYGYLTASAKSEYRVLSSEPGRIEIAVTAHIHEGPQYRLGELHWKNITVFSAAELEAVYPIIRGEIMDSRKSWEGMNAVRRLYWAKGYVNANCEAKYAFDDSQQTVDLTFEVREGAPFRIGSMKIVSGDPGLKSRVMPMSKLKPGDAFDLGLWQKFLRQVEETAPDGLYGWERHDLRAGIADLTLFLGVEPEEDTDPADSQTEGEGSWDWGSGEGSWTYQILPKPNREQMASPSR